MHENVSICALLYFNWCSRVNKQKAFSTKIEMKYISLVLPNYQLSNLLFKDNEIFETSLVPATSSCRKFCHWSSNGLAAPDFSKIFIKELFWMVTLPHSKINFTPCSSVSMVNFEQVNTGWEQNLAMLLQ